MRWQDRTLLILGLVLLLLFIIRSETAVANTLEWGIQFISDSGNHTELALETEVKLEPESTGPGQNRQPGRAAARKPV